MASREAGGGLAPATRDVVLLIDNTGFDVIVVETVGVEQVELTEPVKALREAGARVDVISPKQGQIQGFNHTDKADSLKVDRQLNQVSPDEYDAVLLPGGALNADAMRMEPTVQSFIKAMHGAGKPMAVICHAPWALISAGVVAGRTMTSYHTLQDDIKNAGATWVDQEVCVDGSLVSSRQPSDLPAFNREIISMASKVPTTA